ncbi:hypothetical protein [Natrinema salifodinae]|uniref:C2H2-type domain-containing protein n=1 Tax=Natrinema salifodinae TaxID=1202768 RepID=A0A1I0P4Q2_9EURY|nr:hypothetical protein [Natrinema salifodinae]SEW09038.1 hypothetical protein SAMN05216285_2121 [Natrinema salifodinae]
MTFQPPVECPICRETLALDRTLEDHLVGAHTQRELARYLAALNERIEIRPLSD